MRKIPITCVLSMWRNHIKCKYMFLFPLKHLAPKGLRCCHVGWGNVIYKLLAIACFLLIKSSYVLRVVKLLNKWWPTASSTSVRTMSYASVTSWGGWGCEVSCGGHHRPKGKTTTGSALDGAVFDTAQILAYLVHNMSRSQLYLGFGHFGWLPSFFGQ